MLVKCGLSAVFFITILIHYTVSKSSNDQVEFLEKQRKKITDKGSKCSLKKLSIRNLDHLRLTSKSTEVPIACILEAMKDKELQTSGVLWTTLGSLYQKLGQKSPTTTCFKQAAKLSGKISPYIKDWSFLGPFVIGKMELDGDPIESFGGIKNVSQTRYKKNVKFYSELLPGGEIQWSYVKQTSADVAVQVKQQVNWNELVNSLGSMGITEWQGWAVGELAVNEDNQNVLIQCLGVHTVYIDNTPITGDVYHRKQFWYGIQLDQGLHTVYIRLRTKINAQFLCKYQISKNNFEVLEPSFLPDLFDGHLFSEYITMPIANYHHSNFLKISKVSLTDLYSKQAEIITKLEIKLKSESSISIAPGQIMPVVLRLSSKNLGSTKIIEKCSDPESPWDIEFNIKFTTSAGVVVLPMKLRCRHARQSFLFTFLDHDGSVQHAAAIQPVQNCATGSCPTVLSLHGTTIAPQNQADSYKHMADGQTDYMFGFNHAWTLAPTRHGAHNWEGPGLLTAISALDGLASLTKRADWLENKADPYHVVYTGHSMGGHGAWHVASHYPDRALALVSLAGWIKKEEYGDSNLFFRHDIGTSHVEPAVKSIMESCIIENDVDHHVTNLHGIAMVTRIGAQDRTVHPWFVRRMYRLLREEGLKVNYTEVKDKEHWWWDTVETNDGGAVNDKYLRDFINLYIDEFVQSGENACVEEECKAARAENLYTVQDSDRKFRLVTYNPALGEGMLGIKVLQQITPYRRSEILGEIKDSQITMTTRNVLRFSLSASPNRNIEWNKYTIRVDSTKDLLADIQVADKQEFCLNKGNWVLCDSEINTATNRGPLTLGPARRIAENPLQIIIGTSGSEESQVYIQQAAVYISNLFFLTSDASIDIVKDTDISIEDLCKTNVIIIGNTTENIHTESFLKTVPIQSSTDAVTLEQCLFPDPRTGILSLAPNGDSHLALLLMGTSLEGLQDIVSLATPTIPPMTRSPFSNLVPDYVVTGPDFGRKGAGGYLCAGFYGNHWEYRPDVSSCACRY